MEFKLYKTEDEAEIDIAKEISDRYNRYNGTYFLVGPINKRDYSQRTHQLLNMYSAFMYDNENGTGQRFTSKLNLNEIPNGIDKLLELLDSVDKSICHIKQLEY